MAKYFEASLGGKSASPLNRSLLFTTSRLQQLYLAKRSKWALLAVSKLALDNQNNSVATMTTNWENLTVQVDFGRVAHCPVFEIGKGAICAIQNAPFKFGPRIAVGRAGEFHRRPRQELRFVCTEPRKGGNERRFRSPLDVHRRRIIGSEDDRTVLKYHTAILLLNRRTQNGICILPKEPKIYSNGYNLTKLYYCVIFTRICQFQSRVAKQLKGGNNLNFQPFWRWRERGENMLSDGTRTGADFCQKCYAATPSVYCKQPQSWVIHNSRN